MTLVGCGGDEEVEKADSAPKADSTPLEERVLTAKDVPGSKPDPVEVRQTPEDLDEVVNVFANFANAPDMDEITNVFKKAGVEEAVLDSRYIGKTHTGEAPHVIALVVQAQSEEGATSALDFIEKDYKQPCPKSCAVKNSDFQVDAIPGARGVYRAPPPRTSRGSEHPTKSRSKATGWASPTVHMPPCQSCMDHPDLCLSRRLSDRNRLLQASRGRLGSCGSRAAPDLLREAAQVGCSEKGAGPLRGASFGQLISVRAREPPPRFSRLQNRPRQCLCRGRSFC